MFDKKRTLIFAIVLYAVGFGLLIPNIIYSYSDWHEGATALTAVSGICIIAAVFLTVIFARICVKEKNETANNGKTDAVSFEELKKRYNSLENYGKQGVVHRWGTKDIGYSATGKFVLAENYKCKNGYHLALEICCEKPRSFRAAELKQNNAEPSCIFKINIGYHNDVALSRSENKNGIILENDDLQGKTVKFFDGEGYNCDIEANVTHSIDCGTLEIMEWNEINHIVAFKCVVQYGEQAVYYGILNLTRDNSYSDEENGSDEAKFSEWLASIEPLSKLGARLEKTQAKTFTKFGGMPVVPEGFKWPTEYNPVADCAQPIPFLLQLDFSEINAAGELRDFPQKGLLYVFVDNENYDYKILFFEKAEALAKAAKPALLEIVYKEFRVSANTVKTYPDIDDSDAAAELGGKLPYWGADDTYSDIQKVNLDSFMAGGWPSHVQEGGFIKKLNGNGNGEWTLLLQIGSADDDENFTWGDAGTLYFYIRTEDLKLRRFDNTELDAQSY